MTTLIRVDGVPGEGCTEGELRFRAAGSSAYLSAPTFLARFSLEHGNLDWVIERRVTPRAESTWNHPRPIGICGSDLWLSTNGDIMAELLPTEGGEAVISTRDAQTGTHLWERFIPIPVAAEWAESQPAWEGARTEEVHAFLGDDPRWLVVFLFREARRRCYICPAQDIAVRTLPPYGCQTDALRLDPLKGRPVWSGSFPGAKVGMLERIAFTGAWSRGSKLGVIDFESGKTTTVYKSLHVLGPPLRDGRLLAVPWHAKKTVGVDWIEPPGNLVRQAAWDCPGVRSTRLHRTEGDLALQANDQMLWWLGRSEAPLWRIRAKPYIYNVSRSQSTDVFVGTDGQGGRLFAYNAATGAETLNFRPVFGGAGMIVKVPGYDALVAR